MANDDRGKDTQAAAKAREEVETQPAASPAPAHDAAQPGLEESLAEENIRIDLRRQVHKGDEHPGGARKWALAVSGGGIRSATFALGVLQALACSSAPPDTRGTQPKHRLIRFFDYLSTVSGGGYIGGFFCSLFIPDRVRPKKAGAGVGVVRAWFQAVRRTFARPAAAGARPAKGGLAAADIAYDVLAYEPPGRYRKAERFATSPNGKFPMAWLRDNGRYLLPTGAGDTFYAAAIAIRNWVSLHYVIGTVLLFAIALVATIRSFLCLAWNDYAVVERILLENTANAAYWWQCVWWSPIAFLPLLFVALLVAVGVAYWLAHPIPGQTEGEGVLPITPAAFVAAAIALALWWTARNVPSTDDWKNVRDTLYALAAIAAAGFAIHFLTSIWGATVAEQRVAMTRLLSNLLKLCLALAFLGIMDTIGQTIYRWAFDWTRIAPTAGAAGVLVWAIRQGAGLLLRKKTRMAKVGMATIGWIAGLVLLLLVLLVWQSVVHWFEWHGGAPRADAMRDAGRFTSLWTLALGAFALAFATGKFANFVNLSSLHSFYSARLTRAYLGASNGARFVDGRYATVAEPHPRDDLTAQEYYGERGDVLAPLHIINVTMNETSDPGEELVQRDRKGEPVAILPGGFAIDGNFARFPARSWFEIQRPLTVGGWIGTSGAAFSTGLGRATSPGLSLALGLANVRLGRWWESGRGERSWGRLHSYLELFFTSQTYLYYELTGNFHGLARRWQYLTDGGHFENTALYELLRKERDISFIVACDDGADPSYEFGDLANLVRLARIDLRAEVEVDRQITSHFRLGRLFGAPEDLRKRNSNSEKCAVLLTVRYVSDVPCKRDAIDRVIVLLKPCVIASVEADVTEYSRTHPAFPQESTSDQFYDEAQWESYRKLGKTIADRVLGDGPDGLGAELWAYLRSTYPGIAGSAAPTPPNAS